MVIRCFKKEHEFAKVNVDRVNQNVRMVFHNNAATEWLGYRLEMIGTTVLCALALLLVLLPARLSPPRKPALQLSTCEIRYFLMRSICVSMSILLDAAC